jgi:RNA polymerase sigma factor (sigma-70 family)
MRPHRLSPVLRHIRAVGGGADPDGVSDAHLLANFIGHGDGAAFEALVRRHGPMVLGVCRRVLGDAHAAEDAFQATFLLLVRKARSLRRPDLLGPWLYGVARRTAAKARAVADRRRREVSSVDVPIEPTIRESIGADDLRPVLDAALARLPARYRTPVVLCYLQGLTYAEAARHLGCPSGTVATRLARAKERLRTLLLRQGVAPAAGLLDAVLTPDGTAAAVPEELRRAAVCYAVAVAAGRAASASIPAAVLTLTNQVGQAMILDKLKAWLAVVVLGMAGAGVVLYRTAAAETPASAEPPAVVAAPPAAQPGAGEHAIPLGLLRQKVPDTYRVDVGDILGVFVEGVLGERGQPPPIIPMNSITSGTTLPPAIGYPIPVQEDGTLMLPLLDSPNVRGKSVTEVRDLLRNTYNAQQMLAPGARALVTLARPRNYRVTVIRPGLPGPAGGPPREASTVLDLPAYENDVLTALARSGGLPGRGATAVVIQRDAAGSTGVQQIRIPLRMRPDAPPPFRPEDIVLRNGDIVTVEGPAAEPAADAGPAARPESPVLAPLSLSLAVAAPGGRVLVQRPAGSWQLVGAAELQAFETDGRAVGAKDLTDRLQTMTAVLVAADGRKPDPMYLRAVKPGTLILVPPPPNQD